MGGGYTAFEDDPVSVWSNPAGMASQSGGMSLQAQTYPVYKRSDSAVPPGRVPARVGLNGPAGVPSFFGALYQIGSEERPQALGVCFTSPLLLRMAFDGPDDSVSPNVWTTTQSFFRIRLAYARDFRFRPVGEEGWMPHLSVGLGGDLAFSRFEMTDLVLDKTDRETRSEFGGGLGMLLGLFDNTRNLKINVGMAYQSAIGLDMRELHGEDLLNGPSLNWPEQIHIGILVYLLEGLPLRLTADALLTNWRGASERSELPGVDSFSRTVTFSVGGEYRVSLDGATTLFPRLGVRFYDPPWLTNQRGRLPATEEWQLVLSTRDDRFVVFSAGLGVSFTGAGGRVTSLDVSFEIGGDAPGAAIGITAGF
jgi:hypothetical protein